MKVTVRCNLWVITTTDTQKPRRLIWKSGTGTWINGKLTKWCIHFVSSSGLSFVHLFHANVLMQVCVIREFIRTAWDDIERFKDQKDKDLREALISYAIMQISMCKKVWRHSSTVSFFLYIQLFKGLHFDCLVFLTFSALVNCFRESRCGPTPRSVSTRCEPLHTPVTLCTKTIVSQTVQTGTNRSVMGMGWWPNTASTLLAMLTNNSANLPFVFLSHPQTPICKQWD